MLIFQFFDRFFFLIFCFKKNFESLSFFHFLDVFQFFLFSWFRFFADKIKISSRPENFLNADTDWGFTGIFFTDTDLDFSDVDSVMISVANESPSLSQIRC